MVNNNCMYTRKSLSVHTLIFHIAVIVVHVNHGLRAGITHVNPQGSVCLFQRLEKSAERSQKNNDFYL